jgi:hypothetical protein
LQNPKKHGENREFQIPKNNRPKQPDMHHLALWPRSRATTLSYTAKSTTFRQKIEENA